MATEGGGSGARRTAGPIFLLALLGVLLVLSFVSTTSLLQFLFAPPSTKSYQAELEAMVSTLKAKGNGKAKGPKASRPSIKGAVSPGVSSSQRVRKTTAPSPAVEQATNISGGDLRFHDGPPSQQGPDAKGADVTPVQPQPLPAPSTSFSINPDSIEAFEAGEEDKEMALIFQIVRMAEQKELQAKQERDVKLAREASAIGMSPEQYILQQRSLGSMAESILEMPCQSVGDCNSACLEICTHQRVSDQCQQECHRGCGVECSQGVPPSKGSKRAKGAAAASAYRQAPECTMQCEGSCRRRCISEKASAMEQMQMECQATNTKICALQCRGNSKAEQCKGSCIARALAECRKSYEGDCEARCGRHVCVEGSCKCPVYFSGDPMCTAVMPIHHMMPEGLKHCSTPWTDDRFKKGSGRNHSVLDYGTTVSPILLDMHYKHTLRTGARLHPQADLRDLADFSTCAVVGSSSTLSASGQGAEIDEHTAVIRFNDAPTKGHQADVGSKTTLRLQNVIYCGFHEFQSELCLHYTGFKGNYCPAARQKRFKCNYIWMSNRLLSYVQNFFNRNVFTGMAATKDTSAGFFGILLSLHLCGKVDLYGFNQRSSHYFNKQINSKRSFGDKHAWALERQCMNLFSNLPAVTKRS